MSVIKGIICVVLLLAGLLDWLVFHGEHMRWLALGAATLLVLAAVATWRRGNVHA